MKEIKDLMKACSSLMGEVTGWSGVTDWGLVNDAMIAGGKAVADAPRLAEEVERLRAVNTELVERLKLAVRYLEHPDVQAIQFSLPAAAVVDRCNEAIDHGEGRE